MNIFAAIDLETTGLDPARSEVIDIAIVPLNPDFTVSTEIPEFSCRIRAEHPERADRPMPKKSEKSLENTDLSSA